MVFSTWAHHLAFGYDLVAAVRPEVLVELGTWSGLSFFCFCQSLEEHAIDGICYAVDTWEGDKHTGLYEDDVYQQVAKHWREYYANTAYLMRMTFNQAAEHFNDNSIDLLHIDGLHTYEAVSQDFATWYPKVKPGGVIIMHDIYARLMDFGVWRFWQERSPEFDSFEFKHGFGLGVLRKPGGPALETPLLQLLFSSDGEEHSKLRSLYFHTTSHVLLRRRFRRWHPGKKILPECDNNGSEDKTPTPNLAVDATRKAS
jgi:hypothetical protein